MTKPLHLEDINIGDRWVSPSRTITRECVMLFAELTGDHDPLHTDDAFARNSAFRQPIAHGLLGLSILAGLSSQHPQVKTMAFTDIGDWQFKRPIYFDDTVHAETEVVQIVQHGRRAGKVTWFRQLVNQNGLVVQQGSFETIVAAKTALSTRKPVAVAQLS